MKKAQKHIKEYIKTAIEEGSRFSLADAKETFFQHEDFWTEGADEWTPNNSEIEAAARLAVSKLKTYRAACRKAATEAMDI